MNYQIKKDKAIEIMEQLKIYKPYIENFRKNNTITLFERFGGYYIEKNSTLYEKIKDIENKYNCLVYAVTHEMTCFGECYSMLVISDYEEDLESHIYSEYDKHSVFSYVWNKTDEYCSEFGSIGLKSFGGGIMRFA